MNKLGHKDHHEKSYGPVGVYVITVSDTRTEETDTSGALIMEKLVAAAHTVTGFRIAPDEPAVIREILSNLPAGTQAVIINGGTGISKRDNTFEAIESMLDKKLPGFGELFRALSYAEIGAAAMMSRATAGVMRGVSVMSVPGSRGAVALAMEKIIIPELAHFVWEANR
ncbi:MAG: molybdenum cofactor biosynthesis protein B [bacterium]